MVEAFDRRKQVRKYYANRIAVDAAKADGDLPNGSVLLVDDVMTTGVTANEAARTLRKAGASSVSLAVIARASSIR